MIAPTFQRAATASPQLQFGWTTRQIALTGDDASGGLIESPSWIPGDLLVWSNILPLGDFANVSASRRLLVGVSDDHGPNGDPGGIGLYAAPAVHGPWVEQGSSPVLTQQAAPTVNQLEFALLLWNYSRGGISVLAHGPSSDATGGLDDQGQRQHRWTIDDPVNALTTFTYRDRPLDPNGLGINGQNHNGYWSIDDYTAGVGYRGRMLVGGGNQPWYQRWWSPDGERFEFLGRPYGRNAMNLTGVVDETVTVGRSFTYAGEKWHLLIYGDGQVAGASGPRGVAIAQVDERQELHVVTNPTVLFEAGASGTFWENGATAMPLSLDGKVYIYVTGRDASDVQRVGLYELRPDTRSRATTLAFTNPSLTHDKAGNYLFAQGAEPERRRIPFSVLEDRTLVASGTAETEVAEFPPTYTLKKDNANSAAITVVDGACRYDPESTLDGTLESFTHFLSPAFDPTDYSELVITIRGLHWSLSTGATPSFYMGFGDGDLTDDVSDGVAAQLSTSTGKLVVRWFTTALQVGRPELYLGQNGAILWQEQDITLAFRPIEKRIRVFAPDCKYDAVHSDLVLPATVRPYVRPFVRGSHDWVEHRDIELTRVRRLTDK